MIEYRARAEEIASRLATLPDAGRVHARSRISINWGEYLKAMTEPESKRVAAWTVTRPKAGIGEGAPHWVETYTLVRVLGVSDAAESEFAFQESIDDAVREFRDHPTFAWGSVTGELTLLIAEERLVGGTLCHVAECELTVTIYYDNL